MWISEITVHDLILNDPSSLFISNFLRHMIQNIELVIGRLERGTVVEHPVKKYTEAPNVCTLIILYSVGAGFVKLTLVSYLSCLRCGY